MKLLLFCAGSLNQIRIRKHCLWVQQHYNVSQVPLPVVFTDLSAVVIPYTSMQ